MPGVRAPLARRLARRFGLPRNTLVYCDRIGLLCPRRSGDGDYRRYTEADAELARAGGNDSLVHIGFTTGSAALDVDGVDANGTTTAVRRDGKWAF